MGEINGKSAGLLTGILLLLLLAIGYLMLPKAPPERMSELLTDEWSVTQIGKLYRRLGCRELEKITPNSQCDYIAKIHRQKNQKVEIKEIIIIENDVLIMPNGEIVGWRLTDGQIE